MMHNLGAAAEMPELRTVLVIAPPLLADLIRRVLTNRCSVSVLVGIAEPADASKRLHELQPDVVIIGPASAPSPLPPAAAAPQARVLTISPDLSHILGPDA